MALTVKPLLSAEVLAGIGAAVGTSYKATISVYTLVSRTYVPGTDEWTEVRDVHYSGPARVQPVRSAARVDVPTNPTSIQNVQVTVPISGLTEAIRTEHLMQVTACTNNPWLLDYTFVVSDVIDSSNPVEWTFSCTVDQESHDG